MKRVISIFLVVLVFTALPAAAVAETWTELDFTMEAPEGMYQLSPNLREDDSLWALAGIADIQAKLKEYSDMGVLVNFLSEDRKTDINVMKKESDSAKQIHDLRLLSEEERTKFLDELIRAKDETVTVQRDWYPAGDYLFYRVKLDVSGEPPMHELMYGTIINGYALNFDIHSMDQDLTPEQETLMQELVDSVRFTQITEKPPEDAAAAFNMLLLLLLVLCAVIAPLIYIPLRSKSDKKKKAKLAEQLSEYHRTHGSNTAEGEPVFVNATDCTREAIHKFSLYQAYVKNIGEVVFGTLLCVVMVAVAFLMETEWWIKLAVLGVSGYYAYKLISMPGAVEKIQTKVHGRGTSQTAHYTFYPEAFRVSGVQSASVLPYFQITSVRRWGQYLYLYYGPDNAYLVDNYGFTQGEFQEFEKFIRQKAGEK